MEDSRALLLALRRGDPAAWRQTVARHEPGLRRLARSYRLAPADVDDVLQTTWLRLHLHAGGVREPQALAGWLATTARREALRLLQRPVNELPTDDPELGDAPDGGGPETVLLAQERRTVLARAIAGLPPGQRRLMRVLADEATCDYTTVSRVLDMPRGSIGPVRARALARLAEHPDVRALAE